MCFYLCRIIFLTFFLSTIFNILQIQAKTIKAVKTNEIMDLYEEVENAFSKKICNPKKTLVVFDLDETLITSKSTDYLDFVKQLKSADCKIKIFKETNLQLVYYFDEISRASGTSRIYSQKKVDTTQIGVEDILSKLKAKTRVLALTSRYPLFQHLTEKETRFANVTFDHQKQELAFDEKQLIDVTEDSLVPELRDYFTKNHLSIKLKVHRDLCEFDQSTNHLKGYRFTFSLPQEPWVLEYLKANNNTYYLFSNNDFISA
ncbi:MAG: DUF2608 domain-containing protein [Oligoflexia bacterium]|nr:DUF2608 domain-containing protein [Oligoflexia bacterium]